MDPGSFYLMSLWWFACTGGTREPVMTQGAPVAGREVGLMYSFSSQSDFSPLDAADAGGDLHTHTHTHTLKMTNKL